MTTQEASERLRDELELFCRHPYTVSYGKASLHVWVADAVDQSRLPVSFEGYPVDSHVRLTTKSH